MTVFVLYRYWNTPDNEGADVIGVYRDVKNAIFTMRSAAKEVMSYYSEDYWEEDMTWEDNMEIHLGHASYNRYESSTIYCWSGLDCCS